MDNAPGLLFCGGGAYVVFAVVFGDSRDGGDGQGKRNIKDGFKGREHLEAWLEDQPHQVHVSMASRGAARVFPLLAGEKADAVILPVLRAIAVSRFAANWPNRETESGEGRRRFRSAVPPFRPPPFRRRSAVPPFRRFRRRFRRPVSPPVPPPIPPVPPVPPVPPPFPPFPPFPPIPPLPGTK